MLFVIGSNQNSSFLNYMDHNSLSVKCQEKFCFPVTMINEMFLPNRIRLISLIYGKNKV